MGILRGGRMRFAWLVTLVLLAALALSNFMQSSMSMSTELSPTASEGDFSNPKFATQDHVSEVTYLGTDYGGWAFDEKLVGSSPVVYSFGLGEDISWDAAMIEKYNVRLFGFDPTPKVREAKTAIFYFAQLELELVGQTMTQKPNLTTCIFERSPRHSLSHR
ncbi:hypothetical protein THAOC_11220 [Thalassiosira oceanica]|uniref:Methyltransferase domain-containing protein n=1 Tax=Thalassiosira oceanica TaxID=159749 RepID=K0TB92_THAOC|nr:hypothetical protein THAOC_11220 [Thalassiosira oceanica]|eukprot:EJK67712.1 hypothetical protein THAOC_11220 [Thalassiosira oceanica]